MACNDCGVVLERNTKDTSKCVSEKLILQGLVSVLAALIILVTVAVFDVGAGGENVNYFAVIL